MIKLANVDNVQTRQPALVWDSRQTSQLPQSSKQKCIEEYEYALRVGHVEITITIRLTYCNYSR